MAKLTAYNIKIKVYCSDDNQARAVQMAANDISTSTNIIGEDVVGFYSKFKRNENIIIPVLKDVMRNGATAITRHLLTLRKIK